MKVQHLKDFQTQRNYLQHLNLLKPSVQPKQVENFIEYENFLKKSIQKGNLNQHNFTNKIRIIMKIFEQDLGRCLAGVVKKAVFLHTFMRIASEVEFYSDQFAEHIETFLKEILQKQIPAINCFKKTVQQKEKKKQGSLSKLYRMVRSISKQRREPTPSKLKLENTAQRGALREINAKIVVPFVSYLLVLNDNYTLHASILSSNFSAESWHSLKWKLHNKLSTLGQLTKELNRLGRYYKQELTGIWVVVNYRISRDIKVYYDLLVEDAGKRAQQWEQAINVATQLAKISRQHKQKLSDFAKDQKLLQLKQEIEMVLQQKETNSYLYQNTVISKWLEYMEQPKYLGDVKQIASMEFVLQFCLSQPVRDSVSVSKKKQEKSSITYSALRKRQHSEMTTSMNSTGIEENAFEDTQNTTKKPYRQGRLSNWADSDSISFDFKAIKRRIMNM